MRGRERGYRGGRAGCFCSCCSTTGAARPSPTKQAAQGGRQPLSACDSCARQGAHQSWGRAGQAGGGGGWRRWLSGGGQWRGWSSRCRRRRLGDSRRHRRRRLLRHHRLDRQDVQRCQLVRPHPAGRDGRRGATGPTPTLTTSLNRRARRGKHGQGQSSGCGPSPGARLPITTTPLFSPGRARTPPGTAQTPRPGPPGPPGHAGRGMPPQCPPVECPHTSAGGTGCQPLPRAHPGP